MWPQETTVQLHQRLRRAALRMRDLGLLTDEELAPYTALRVKPALVNAPKDLHVRAICTLADIVANAAPHSDALEVPKHG